MKEYYEERISHLSNQVHQKESMNSRLIEKSKTLYIKVTEISTQYKNSLLMSKERD